MQDPINQLLLVFVLIHIIDGALLTRRTAVVFAGWGRFFRVRFARREVLGNARKAVVMLRWWPPFESGFVTELPELTITSEAVLPYAVQRPGRREPPSSWDPVSEAELAEAHAENTAVVGITRLADTSSPLEAERLAAACRSFARAEGVGARTTRFLARVRRSHDTDMIRTRYEQFIKESALLGVLGPIAWVVGFASLFGFFYIPWVWSRWHIFALATVALWLHVLVEFGRAHWVLYPSAVGDRVLKLAMLGFSLPGVARARAFLARDLFVGFHPLAVGCVLLRGQVRVDLAEAYWRDLRYPAHQLSSQPEADVERQAMLTAHRDLFEQFEVAVHDLEALPPSEISAPEAVCPRCLARYEHTLGSCIDCPGVELIAL